MLRCIHSYYKLRAAGRTLAIVQRSNVVPTAARPTMGARNLARLWAVLKPVPSARPDAARVLGLDDADLADIGVSRGEVEAWAEGRIRAMRRRDERAGIVSDHAA
jgi:uncharacterized protein YjiS (DUF1127 family)